ncbi:hypothetical protein JTB14_018819, partial [Gonioctena quinquepunctata]
NTRKSFYAAHLAETKISTRNTRKSFNAAHLGGARACEAGFHSITPRRHDIKENNEERNLQRRKKTPKKENNEERNLQRRKKTTKKETFNVERNHQRRKKPTKKTKLVNDEGFIMFGAMAKVHFNKPIRNMSDNVPNEFMTYFGNGIKILQQQHTHQRK